jgi:hypothetical protein
MGMREMDDEDEGAIGAAEDTSMGDEDEDEAPNTGPEADEPLTAEAESTSFTCHAHQPNKL